MRRDRGNLDCPAGNRSVAAWVIDNQVEAIVTALRLPSDWRQAVEELMATDDERLELVGCQVLFA